MKKVNLEEQIEYCRTCSTYIHATEVLQGDDPVYCPVHRYFDKNKIKPCPCSECIVKIMCVEQCLKLDQHMKFRGQ